jgi:hypothetical protein
MRKETLLAIADKAAVFTKDSESYRTQTGHNIALYLGELGNAMVISGIQAMIFCPEYLEVNAKPHTTFFVSYEAIHALSIKQEESTDDSRANVGF